MRCASPSPTTCAGHIYPARHDAGSGSCNDQPADGPAPAAQGVVRRVPPLPRQAQVIAVAMQRYGIIVADNGTQWYVQGASNAHFNDDAPAPTRPDHGDDFVVVDTSNLRNG